MLSAVTNTNITKVIGLLVQVKATALLFSLLNMGRVIINWMLCSSNHVVKGNSEIGEKANPYGMCGDAFDDRLLTYLKYLLGENSDLKACVHTWLQISKNA